ncbi:MAG: hypothetical protein AAF916_10600, partial [Planctomycetota bacterium]
MEGKDTSPRTAIGPSWDEQRWASRRNLSAWLIGLLMGAMLVFAFGCSTSRNLDLSPQATAASYGRSATFFPEAFQQVPAPAGTRWYHGRNDAGLEVFAGYDVF